MLYVLTHPTNSHLIIIGYSQACINEARSKDSHWITYGSYLLDRLRKVAL